MMLAAADPDGVGVRRSVEDAMDVRQPYRLSRRQRRRLAGQMAIVVIGLQCAVIASFWLDGSVPPGHALGQLLWADAHRASFYPLVALIMLGPPLSVLALAMHRRHRRLIPASWIAFIILALVIGQHRLLVMLQVLWQQLT
jgi:hypothetical protein